VLNKREIDEDVEDYYDISFKCKDMTNIHEGVDIAV
jgi:hypothetical protein